MGYSAFALLRAAVPNTAPHSDVVTPNSTELSHKAGGACRWWRRASCGSPPPRTWPCLALQELPRFARPTHEAHCHPLAQLPSIRGMLPLVECGRDAIANITSGQTLWTWVNEAGHIQHPLPVDHVLLALRSASLDRLGVAETLHVGQPTH